MALVHSFWAKGLADLSVHGRGVMVHGLQGFQPVRVSMIFYVRGLGVLASGFNSDYLVHVNLVGHPGVGVSADCLIDNDSSSI